MFWSPQTRTLPTRLPAANTSPPSVILHAAGGGGGTATAAATASPPSAATGTATGAAAATGSPPTVAAAGTRGTACRLGLEDMCRSLFTFSSWACSKISFIPSSSTMPQQPGGNSVKHGVACGGRQADVSGHKPNCKATHPRRKRVSSFSKLSSRQSSAFVGWSALSTVSSDLLLGVGPTGAAGGMLIKSSSCWNLCKNSAAAADCPRCVCLGTLTLTMRGSCCITCDNTRI